MQMKLEETNAWQKLWHVFSKWNEHCPKFQRHSAVEEGLKDIVFEKASASKFPNSTTKDDSSNIQDISKTTDEDDDESMEWLLRQ